MTGLPHFNFPAFDRLAESFHAEGWLVFSPADNDRRLLGKPPGWLPQESDTIGPWREWAIPGAPTLRDILASDVDWLIREADAIAMLPGWEHSRGATAEHALAIALKLYIIYT